jgi:hypothetical protein
MNIFSLPLILTVRSVVTEDNLNALLSTCDEWSMCWVPMTSECVRLCVPITLSPH